MPKDSKGKEEKYPLYNSGDGPIRYRFPLPPESDKEYWPEPPMFNGEEDAKR